MDAVNIPQQAAAPATPSMAERVEELRTRRAEVEAGGGEKRLARQREGGRLTARERVAELLDPDSFNWWLERNRDRPPPWPPETTSDPPPEPPAPEAARPRRYACRHEKEPPPRLVFREEDELELKAALWEAILAATQADKCGDTRIGVVTSEPEAFGRLRKDVFVLRRCLSGHEGDDPTLVSPLARPFFKPLLEAGVPIGDPVVLDHLPRSRAALKGRASPCPSSRKRCSRGATAGPRRGGCWRAPLGHGRFLARAGSGFDCLGVEGRERSRRRDRLGRSISRRTARVVGGNRRPGSDSIRWRFGPCC